MTLFFGIDCDILNYFALLAIAGALQAGIQPLSMV